MRLRCVSEQRKNTHSRANEFYSYYNGYVYHIGYQLDGDPQEVQEKMAILARDFILGE